MQMLKGYYAHLAIVAGIVVKLIMLQNAVLASNWVVEMVAYAIIAAGALPLQHTSRWFWRASITADVLIGFTVLCGPKIIPPSFAVILLEHVKMIPLILLGSMLLMGVAEQMRTAGNSAALEWIMLVLWSTGYILWLILAFGWVNEYLFEQTLRVIHLLLPLGHIAVIVDMFRAQLLHIRLEVDKT